MNTDLIKIAVALFCGLLIGFEREYQDKPAGLRTIMFIVLGATLTTIFSLKYVGLGNEFDAIRAIAYYLVAIGFVGGGIIRKSTKTDGITTATLLLPMSVVGLFCGIGEFSIAVISTCVIFLVLMLKYVHLKMKVVLGGKHEKSKRQTKRHSRRIRKRTGIKS